MKHSRRILIFLLTTLLLIATVMSVVACTPPDDGSDDSNKTDTTDVVTESLAIANGKFANTSGTAYVKTATGWTLTAGVWSKGATGLVTGVVDLSDEAFNSNKGNINSDLAAPGVATNTPKGDNGAYTDNNALVVSMSGSESKGSIYYYSTKSTIKKGEYYKLTVDVWTDLIFDDADADNSKRGASIVVSEGSSASSAIIAEMLSINTDGNWKTYTLYIEGSKLQAKDFYVQLWLGYGPTKYRYMSTSSSDDVASPYITKGTAMFDNVMLTKIDSEEYDRALVAQYNSVTGSAVTERTAATQSVLSVTKDYTAVVSLVYPNRNFVFGSGLSTGSVSKYLESAKQSGGTGYTLTVGKEDLEDSSDFPSYTSESDPVGIFDLTKLYYTKAATEEGDSDDNYADSFKRLSSTFSAPDHGSLGVTYNAETKSYAFSRGDNPSDANALLIYHKDNAISGAGYISNSSLLIEKNKYYAVSVWVYVWIPELDKDTFVGTEPTDTEAADYETKKAAYDEKLAEYNKYSAYENAYATLRLSGATTDEKLEVKSNGSLGEWQKITLKVKGNALADRSVKLEMWYGEGEWGSDTLYPGGCFFDNISVEEFEKADAINAAYEGDIKSWKDVTEDSYNGFGLNGAMNGFTALTTDAASGWTYSLVDSKTYVDMTASDSNLYAGIVSGKTNWDDVSAIPALNGITKPGDYSVDGTVFDYVMLNHAQYTASKLTFKPVDGASILTTKINRFYRLSMWVNTQNLKSGSTFKISVYDKDTDSLINSSATQSSLAFTDWTEVSFLFRADGKEADSMYIVVEFGSGDIYTPASHAKGALFITAMTWSEISYTEYKNASGDYLKSINLASSNSSDSSITNSDFANVSDDNFDLDDDDDAVFDKDSGEMTGIAKPTGWTVSSVAYALDAPTVTATTSSGILTWEHTIKEVTHYYIYSDKVKLSDDSDKTGDKKLVKIIDATDTNYFTTTTTGEGESAVTTTKFTYKPATTNNYYVRAVVKDDKTVKYVSALSTSKKVSTLADGNESSEKYIPKDLVDVALESVKSGIIDVNNYAGFQDEDKKGFYPTEEGKLTYQSPVSNVLMITSAYPTYIGYTNTSSASLSANSYYRLSVWVKTVDHAKASVTLKNSSKILSVTTSDEKNGDYVGYTNIDTNGNWVRYDIYITTNMSSASLTLELFLGNKYANNITSIGEGADATKVSSGLSSGTVYFDDVMLTKLDDVDEYNAFANAATKEDGSAILVENKDVTGSFYSNTYYYTTVDYHIDSFDSFTKNTKDDNAAEWLLGNEAGAYTHGTQTAVYNADGDTADNDHPNHVYGVYNRTGDFTKLLDHMTDKSYTSTSGYALADKYTSDQLKNFLTSGEEGNNNYLMMANITVPSAQYYKSSSMTMSSGSYYKVTFKAKVLSPVEGKQAEFRFIYNSSSNQWESIYLSASEDMVEYTFYYANETTSSVTAYLGFYLGSYDAKGDATKVQNYMSGILIVDDVSVVKMADKEAYTADKTETEANEELKGKYASYTSVTEKETPVDDDTDDDDDDDDSKNNINAQVWLILSSVVIGVILIAVIVVLVYRKLKGKVDKKLRKVKVESKMPADLEAQKATTKTKGKDRKKDITTSDYDD